RRLGGPARQGPAEARHEPCRPAARVTAMSGSFDDRYEPGTLDELPGDEAARREQAPRPAPQPLARRRRAPAPDRELRGGHRNVDLRIFGEHKARSIIDLSRAAPDDRTRLRAHIDAGEVTAVYVHLAEGVDDRSRKEFQELVDANLLTAATVIIHGTALTDANLADVKDAGAKLVWSPQSNLRLYGDTTHAAKALQLEIPLGIGADWLPSGSQSLLGELKVARRRLLQQGAPAGALAKTLVHAVTSGAAAIAGLGDKLGALAAGRPADVLV